MKKKLNERGLPSVGGISPGDTSNNLGQARRPWNMTGAAGGHTQSADSGFSSRLGRVNKGRETDKEYAYRIRFPDNEEESEEPEEDKYDMKIRSKISLDLRGRKPMPEVRTLMSVLNCNVDDLIRENEDLQTIIDEDIVEDEEDEIEEASVAGSIGGYVGPMSSPANPKDFYERMLKSSPGSRYINDLPKSRV